MFGRRQRSVFTTLVLIDTATGAVRRFVGRKCTHDAEFVGGMSAVTAADVEHFRLYPDNSMQYTPA